MFYVTKMYQNLRTETLFKSQEDVFVKNAISNTKKSR